MAATSPAKKLTPVPAELPMEGYDRLPVREILPRLTELSGPELRAVGAYERAGKNRVTLLRAVRKVELARDEATPATPASHLTVVEDDTGSAVGSEWVLDEPELEVVDLDDQELDDWSGWGDEIETDSDTEAASQWADEDSEVDAEAHRAAGDTEIDAESEWGLDDPGTDGGWAMLDEPEDDAETVAEPESVVAGELPDLAPFAEEAEKTPRKRPAVKGATWEEELRPQLPRRIESTSFDLEPPVVAQPAAEPVAASVAPRKGHVPGPVKVRKFEGPALVMAAVLAVLLGLAIGTVLARSGGSPTAQSAPASVVEGPAAPVGA